MASKKNNQPSAVWPFSSSEEIKPKKLSKKQQTAKDLAEQEELIQTLKFTPRNYTINLSGYGGEIVIGHVDKKSVDYFDQNDIDIEEFADDWDNELEVPEEFQPFVPGEWHDCDNICHNSGAEMSDLNQLTVYDENGKEVWSCAMDPAVLADAGVQVECVEEYYVNDQAAGSVVFVGQSSEKGQFFDATVELRMPFDPKKIKIFYGDFDGWNLHTAVFYNDEELDGWDHYDTTGKGNYYSIHRIGD